MVATGRAELMVDPVVAVWDLAPLLPILEEAGGTFTDWEGRRTIHSGQAIATNGLVFDEVLGIVTRSPRPLRERVSGERQEKQQSGRSMTDPRRTVSPPGKSSSCSESTPISYGLHCYRPSAALAGVKLGGLFRRAQTPPHK